MRVKIMSATSGDHYRVAQATMDGWREERRESGWWRGRTMGKENTIAGRNGGMHFLLVGARQRCPTRCSCELFEL